MKMKYKNITSIIALIIFVLVAVYADFLLAQEETATTQSRPRTSEENRLGYAGGTLVLEQGTTTIGETKVWTKDGLQAVNVGYKESPNGFDLPWTEVVVHKQDKNVVQYKSVESLGRRNYVAIICKENPRQLVWIPFAAVDTISLEKVRAESYPNVAEEKEVYDNFGFTRNKAEKFDGITLKAVVMLKYPMANGKQKVVGMLTDAIGNLGIYDGYEWKKLPWSSVVAIKFLHSKETTGSSALAVPHFVYRTASQYANAWLEWSIPTKNDK